MSYKKVPSIKHLAERNRAYIDYSEIYPDYFHKEKNFFQKLYELIIQFRDEYIYRNR